MSRASRLLDFGSGGIRPLTSMWTTAGVIFLRIGASDGVLLRGGATGERVGIGGEACRRGREAQCNRRKQLDHLAPKRRARHWMTSAALWMVATARLHVDPPNLIHP